MSLCLTHEEIREITGKDRYSAQIKVLRAMGIESKPRPDGSILVDRALLQRLGPGEGWERSQSVQEKTEPRWDAA